MKKVILLILAAFALSFSQTAIPKPTGCAATAYLNGTPINIGDFDGDGSDDLFLIFYDSNNSTYFFGVYSFKKNLYLLVQTTTTTLDPSFFVFGDFDGDKINEIVVNGIIYKYSSSSAKKKT